MGLGPGMLLQSARRCDGGWKLNRNPALMYHRTCQTLLWSQQRTSLPTLAAVPAIVVSCKVQPHTFPIQQAKQATMRSTSADIADATRKDGVHFEGVPPIGTPSSKAPNPHPPLRSTYVTSQSSCRGLCTMHSTAYSQLPAIVYVSAAGHPAIDRTLAVVSHYIYTLYSKLVSHTSSHILCCKRMHVDSNKLIVWAHNPSRLPSLKVPAGP